MARAADWRCEVLLPHGWEWIRWHGYRGDTTASVLECEMWRPSFGMRWEPIGLHTAQVVAWGEPKELE